MDDNSIDIGPPLTDYVQTFLSVGGANHVGSEKERKKERETEREKERERDRERKKEKTLNSGFASLYSHTDPNV